MSGIRWQSRLTQYCDDNADPLNAGTLTFSVTGTSTPANTYNAPDLMTANANPITLDADGRLPVDVFLDPAVTYRVILKNSAGSNIAQDDPVAGSDITAAIEDHNDDLAAHYAATESQRGFVELANNTEVQTGTDTSRAITPAGLTSRTATETRTGIVELATDAEAVARTSTSVVLTPANLAAAQAGSVIGFASATSTTAVNLNTSVIADDNTIPQNTEGTEYFTVSYTPKFASSLLRVSVFLPLISQEGTVTRFIGAIFRDSTADALVVSVGAGDLDQSGAPFGVQCVVNATAATATTFKFRYGGSTSAGVNIGYAAGSEKFSTAKVALFTVEEIKQ